MKRPSKTALTVAIAVLVTLGGSGYYFLRKLDQGFKELNQAKAARRTTATVVRKEYVKFDKANHSYIGNLGDVIEVPEGSEVWRIYYRINNFDQVPEPKRSALIASERLRVATYGDRFYHLGVEGKELYQSLQENDMLDVSYRYIGDEKEIISVTTQAIHSSSPPQLAEINLAQIGHLTPKGRVQDKEYNQLIVVDQLIANGKNCIPFLISKLEDETKIEGGVIDYWYQIYVGDVALRILSDFFLDRKWERSTIEGMAWDEFLGRGNDQNITSEELLRNYVEKYGRKRIRQRWQDVWDRHKESIYWDEQERAFKLRAS